MMTKEEAIKVYKGIVNPRLKEAFEAFAPELAESEDERMMNQLHSWMNEFGGAEEYAEKVYQWLKQLIEKQKEQKPDYCHHEVDLSDCSEEYRKAYYDGWNNCNIQHEQCKAERKPAEWSKEDEKMRDKIIVHLTSFIYPNSMYSEDAKECIDWLKSLRPQHHWKPTEEQMDALKQVVYNRPISSDELNLLEPLYEDLKKL